MHTLGAVDAEGPVEPPDTLGSAEALDTVDIGEALGTVATIDSALRVERVETLDARDRFGSRSRGCVERLGAAESADSGGSAKTS